MVSTLRKPIRDNAVVFILIIIDGYKVLKRLRPKKLIEVHLGG